MGECRRIAVTFVSSAVRGNVISGATSNTRRIGRVRVARDGARGGTAARSRLAGIGLIAVLLGVSGFAVWSSQTTAVAAARAIAASQRSDNFGRAAGAVAAEESLERKYRLEPSPDVRDRYDAAAADLAAVLVRARRVGDAEDRVLVDRVLARHRHYLDAIHRMFAAVDDGDTATVLRIDSGQVDPAFGAIEKAVRTQAAVEHAAALAQLRHLQSLETLTRRLTPTVFLVGLLLSALLASVTRGYRQLLVVERAQAVHDSLHDALTGLPNRTLLGDRLTQALRAGTRSGTATGLLLIDLDRFKDINDTFGHPYGDQLLTQIGPRLSAAVRTEDTVARLGGDEFAVLLPDIPDVAAAVAVASTLQAALKSPFAVGGVDLDVEASVGVVLSGDHGDDAAILLQRADVAMYVAKTQNIRVCAYDPEVDSHTPARLSLVGDLRRAMERRELTLHYQPKISISTGELIGVEALVRWQHPQRGLVFPDEFIPLAEHTGLIGPLTHCVLDSALAQARVWADGGQALTVSVNLSGRNLLDDQLPDEVADLLAAHGVPACRLELEVTESAIMTEPLRAKRLLDRLSQLGVRISIDDFGAGYTSLGQLKSLPINELKIDRSFVTTMVEDRSNSLIVHSVIDLGHNLGLTIVAEGVETEATLGALAAFGCDVAQGFHLCRPLTAEAVNTWLTDRLAAANVGRAEG